MTKKKAAPKVKKASTVAFTPGEEQVVTISPELADSKTVVDDEKVPAVKIRISGKDMVYPVGVPVRVSWDTYLHLKQINAI